jgi:hypothetical protein
MLTLNLVLLWDLQEQRTSGLSYPDYRYAARNLDGRGRLLLLQEMHRAFGWNVDLRGAAELAARRDDLPCFLYAHDNGAFYYDSPMVLAAQHGALSILEYGFQHRNEIMWFAHPLCTAASTWDKALCIAAGGGHLACVRRLHTCGVRLWDFVQVKPDAWFTSGICISWASFSRPVFCLYVPESRDLLRPLWGVLRYGQLHGAPLPESVGWLFQERRKRAREAMLCFHCAARLSRGGGEHAGLWGLMGKVPMDVVYIILVKADLELEETFRPTVYHITDAMKR